VPVASFEDEGLTLKREMDELARRVNAVGRPLTDQEEAAVVSQSSDLRRRIADWMTRRTILGRPEVLTRGRPVSGAAAKRGLQEARRVLEARRSFRRGCSGCPAATDLPGGGVRCGVEQTTLRPDDDPMSLATFCHGEYKDCPSWRAERERRTTRPLVEA
jgi:hypothetical protein